jgi:pimeloyl-ACP methyl ester carboxylesterase
MDTYSDDLLAVIEHLDLKDIMMVGHSTGGGEVARFVSARPYKNQLPAGEQVQSKAMDV